MFNIKDIVKYKTISNINWGIVEEIANIEASVYQENKGIRLYKVKPLNQILSHDFVVEKDIIQAYAMYYEENYEEYHLESDSTIFKPRKCKVK